MGPLQGRTALICDGDRTIGFAIATALAEAGARVAIHADKDDAAWAAAGKLPGAGHLGTACDLSNAGSLAAMLQALPAHVDILVHVSCPQHLSPVENFPDDAFQHILDIGLISYFRLVKSLIPGMRRRGFGRLIAMASVHGLVASVDKAAYVAAKHGLVGFTKVIALETAGSGVTANAICPGWTGTEGTRAQAVIVAARRGITPEEALAAMLKEKHPSNRFVQVDALGALVVFLCSPAADQITGAALPVDGGWTAH